MIREYRMWIDGRWCGSEDHEILAVEDPSTQQTIAYVQAATEAQVDQAVRSAISVREMFRRTPVGVRYRLLLRIAGEIEKDTEKIARMLSLEQGKPLFREAIPEVEGVIADFRQAAEDLLRMNGEKYDVVILDPPAFTKSREATKNAIKGYREINMKGLKLVKDGGYLATCSCSHFMTQELFTKTIKEAAQSVHKRLRQVEFRTQGPDHPILWAANESYYLKFIIFQVVDEH